MTQTISPIFNELHGADMGVVSLADRQHTRFELEAMAQQLNKQRWQYSPRLEVLDLDQFIADIVWETTAQGASLLEVHVIDPAWMLCQRNSQDASFIDVDEDGYIWPPLEVNFPQGVSSAWWRLCQCRLSTDLTAPNVILTFEDKIVSELRECAGPEISNQNETRAQFLKRLVDQANQRLRGHSVHAYSQLNPVSSTQGAQVNTHEVTLGAIQSPAPYEGIRFQPLLKLGSPDAFSQADLTVNQVSPPASAKQPSPPPARQNPTKQGLAAINQAAATVLNTFSNQFKPTPALSGIAGSGSSLSIAGGFKNTGAVQPNSADYVPNFTYIPGLGTNK